MQITVTAGEQVFTVEVPPDMEIENVKALCEAESGIAMAEMVLLLDGKALSDDKQTAVAAGLKDGEMVLLQRRPRPGQQGQGGVHMPDFSQIVVPGPSSSSSSHPARHSDDPQMIRDMLRANPDQLALLRQNNVRLAEAYDSGSMEEFAKVLKEQHQAREERERQRLRMLTADPFDMEAQRMIAQEIENKNIDQNMELAMEYNPESFGSVIMLYIDCLVNGHHIKAFVDSGAQATIMSQAAAERCGIMRLVDRRWAGIAKGVGTQKILGRVHMAQIQIKDDFLASSFSILQEQPMDMLLGLDMLKRHQCVIDLRKNVLVIGSTGTETSFLPESELPPCARLTGGNLQEAMKASANEAEKKMLKEAIEESKRLKTSNSPGPGGSHSDSTEVKPSDNFTEENVQTLVKYGFSREKCIEELRLHDGNMKNATAALFAKSLKLG